MESLVEQQIVKDMTQGGKKLRDLIEGIEVLDFKGDGEVLVRRICDDSRSVAPGDLFVAVEGLQIDGHRFVQEAQTCGAAAVVVSKPVTPTPVVGSLIRVADTRKAMAQMSAAFWNYPSRHFSLIGVTGTNGKTTLTYLIEEMIKAAGKVPGVIGTVEARYLDRHLKMMHTTPEANVLQKIFHKMFSAGVTHVALEVSSHALSLQRVRGSDFKVAVFTNLSRDHLDFHGDLTSYAKAKSLLFSRELTESKAEDKVAVINQDDPRSEEIVRGWSGRVLGFGLGSDSDVHPIGEVDHDLSGFNAQIATTRGDLDVSCSLPGYHNLQNVLAAVAVAVAIDLPLGAAAAGVAGCKHVSGRMQRVPLGRSGPYVFVDYAHTDQALAKVLSALRPLVRGRLWVVFGCGGDRDRGKRPLMGKEVALCADLAVVTSDNPRTEDPEKIIGEILPGLNSTGWRQVTDHKLGDRSAGSYAIVPDRAEAIGLAVGSLLPEDVLLIAGKGHEDYQILGTRRHHFDDCEQVIQAWQRRMRREKK